MATDSMKAFERATEKKAHNKETHPEKGTKRYTQNEKIINNNPALKQGRDVAQGLEKSASAYSTHGGKGSAARPGNYSQEYKDNWETIFGNKDKSTIKDSKRGFKLRVNGVIVEQEDPYDNDEYARSHDEDNS